MNFMKTKEYLYREFEIRIYDLDGRMVWSKSYYKEERYSRSYISSRKNEEGKRRTEISIVKSVIEDFKLDATREYRKITASL